MPSAIDIFVAYKFIKQLATPWNKWEAYKLGLIDNKGRKLKDVESKTEKAAYPIWKILIRNIKRTLDKIPFGKTKLGSFAGALWLLKEELKIEDISVLEDEFINYLSMSDVLIEADEAGEKINTIEKGRYQAVNGDIIFLRNTTESFATVLGEPLFRLTDGITGKTYLVQSSDIGPF